ncbi:trehalose-phosphate phosphatase D [Pyrus ussuriensis x Pyrus communis]|uniref:Trehalose 6-phosphate phosphatase n=1 Tax=Pyrus ussuriensis x Pyrus communis TaxID=2448454 RepID=A0A5N5HRV4_9ROSA|nr:trehalose-phosphate phosphatase D [Pyrus ussuriensis x Pyrus communis]
MTNQNVIVSDAKGVAIKVTVAKKAMFSQSVPKPMTEGGGGGCFTIPMNIKVLKVDTEGGAARVNAWVDSLRASSPTRVKSATPQSLSETVDYNSWTIHHPSAMSMFEQITNASKGKQIVMFLDYDGTLSPIVEDPDRAFMSKEMRKAVRAAARYFPTAIVSGRCRDKVYSFVKLGELYYAGSHGMDIRGPSKSSKYKNDNQAVLFQPASEFVPMIDEVYKTLLEKTRSISGARVENNKFCLSVHFRCVDEKSWAALAEQVRLVLNEYPKLRLTQGRKVLEIRPTIKWDKGKALEFLLESLGYANSNEVFPVYIGDDRTDEDAFKVLRDRGQGFGILVSKVPKETNASYTLQEPAEVKDFLLRLVKWKRLSNQQRN